MAKDSSAQPPDGRHGRDGLNGVTCRKGFLGRDTRDERHGVDGLDVPFTKSCGFQAKGCPDLFKQTKPLTGPSQLFVLADQAWPFLRYATQFIFVSKI
ncbi:hypothetical protein HC733_12325 [Pseudoalteromonas sp. S16_S37]|uniref:hypothetical protein n=1 Tax=Pseudoalteromonas sp. S16_S37 TaxID=2720228 RepID=UPI001680B24D|nr:hypothetical protein [Pseudoalteromonas sp. S16_S37]MBD1583064.1 hypothetical protein [Pseudoalteromonas sp. S16_S37]